MADTSVDFFIAWIILHTSTALNTNLWVSRPLSYVGREGQEEVASSTPPSAVPGNRADRTSAADDEKAKAVTFLAEWLADDSPNPKPLLVGQQRRYVDKIVACVKRGNTFVEGDLGSGKTTLGVLVCRELKDQFICCHVSIAGCEDAVTAVGMIANELVHSLAQVVPCDDLKAVDENIVSLISRNDSTGLSEFVVRELFATRTIAQETTRLADRIRESGKHVLIWLDDLERIVPNQSGDFGDRYQEKIAPLRAFIHRLRYPEGETVSSSSPIHIVLATDNELRMPDRRKYFASLVSVPGIGIQEVQAILALLNQIHSDGDSSFDNTVESPRSDQGTGVQSERRRMNVAFGLLPDQAGLRSHTLIADLLCAWRRTKPSVEIADRILRGNPLVRVEHALLFGSLKFLEPKVLKKIGEYRHYLAERGNPPVSEDSTYRQEVIRTLRHPDVPPSTDAREGTSGNYDRVRVAHNIGVQIANVARGRRTEVAEAIAIFFDSADVFAIGHLWNWPGESSPNLSAYARPLLQCDPTGEEDASFRQFGSALARCALEALRAAGDSTAITMIVISKIRGLGANRNPRSIEAQSSALVTFMAQLSSIRYETADLAYSLSLFHILQGVYVVIENDLSHDEMDSQMRREDVNAEVSLGEVRLMAMLRDSHWNPGLAHATKRWQKRPGTFLTPSAEAEALMTVYSESGFGQWRQHSLASEDMDMLLYADIDRQPSSENTQPDAVVARFGARNLEPCPELMERLSRRAHGTHG